MRHLLAGVPWPRAGKRGAERRQDPPAAGDGQGCLRGEWHRMRVRMPTRREGVNMGLSVLCPVRLQGLSGGSRLWAQETATLCTDSLGQALGNFSEPRLRTSLESFMWPLTKEKTVHAVLSVRRLQRPRRDLPQPGGRHGLSGRGNPRGRGR